MIWIILSVLLVLVGAGMVVFKAGGSRWLGAIPIGLGVLVFGFACFYTTDVGQANVVTGLGGQPLYTVSDAGVHAKAPWNGVVEFDIRNQAVTFVGNGEQIDVNGDGKVDKIDGPKITAASKDNAAVYIDITVGYEIASTSAEKIYNEFRDKAGLETKQLIPGVRSTVQRGPTNYNIASMQSSRAALTKQISEDLNTRLNQFGISVVTVDIRGMDFDQNVKDSLAKVPAQAAEEAAARAGVEVARQAAEKVKIEAKATSDADQIVRCGATSTSEVRQINGKDETVTVVTPVPNEQCQNRLNEQVLTGKYIDMLREAAAKGNTIYVIPPGTNNLLQLPAQAPATK